MDERRPVFSLGFHRSEAVRIIRAMVEVMTLNEEARLEIIRLQAKVAELQREITRLERELEAQQLGLPTFTISENRLVLFE